MIVSLYIRMSWYMLSILFLFFFFVWPHNTLQYSQNSVFVYAFVNSKYVNHLMPLYNRNIKNNCFYFLLFFLIAWSFIDIWICFFSFFHLFHYNNISWMPTVSKLRDKKQLLHQSTTTTTKHKRYNLHSMQTKFIELFRVVVLFHFLIKLNVCVRSSVHDLLRCSKWLLFPSISIIPSETKNSGWK